MLALCGALISLGWAVWAQAPGERTPADGAGPNAGDQDLRWRAAGSGGAPLGTPPGGVSSGFTPNTSVPATGPAGSTGNRVLPIEPMVPIGREVRRIAKVTTGPGTLPNAAGQVWREYDITPYTMRVTTTQRPEQALVDWILRETGYEAWHGDIVAMLSADRRTLRCYHTPEMHDVVGDLVDRFVNTQAESHAFGLRMITVDKPNWRARTQGFLQPVPVESQGVQAWLVQKEDAAHLIAELRKRTDVREHGSPHLLVQNGQSVTVPLTRPRSFIQGVALRPDIWPGFENQLGQIEEGFSLELSPLLSLNGQTIDAVIKCTIDQVERLHPVMIEAHNAVAPRQRTKIDVPQTSQFRLQERFRWPTDRVLLVALGMVPSPVPGDNKALVPALAGPPRSDVLIFVESRGAMGQPPAALPPGTLPPGGAANPGVVRGEPPVYTGRY
jgi:hypothetical protein